jgi:UDP-N-acetylmuramyl pentapeptide phosphotransferase/UDP-N-acetylglucosamine-1-phosphate transferase
MNMMKDYLFYIIILGLSGILTWLYIKYALHKSLLDIPNDRSSHTVPTPRGGGLAIAIAFYAGLACMFMWQMVDKRLFFALLSGIPLTITGLIDDVFSLKPKARFAIQLITALAALYFLGGLQILDLGFHSFNLLQSPLFFFIINAAVVVAIIWSVNLFNFLDGIDGYLGIEVLFLGIGSFLFTGNSIGVLLVASVGGFLYWNWPKAKIFMGDVGSTLLGFIIAVFIIYFQNLQLISIISWMILTSIFWFDATVTIVRRYMNKEDLSQAHRKHAFQRIVQAGFSHLKTDMYLILLNVVGLGLTIISENYPSFALLCLLIDLGLLVIVYQAIEKKKAF